MSNVFIFLYCNEDPVQHNLVQRTILSAPSNQLYFIPITANETISAKSWFSFTNRIKDAVRNFEGNPTIHLFFEVENASPKEIYFLSELDKKVQAKHTIPYTSNFSCVDSINTWYEKNQRCKTPQSTLNIEVGNLLECVYSVTGAIDPDVVFLEQSSLGAELSDLSESQTSSLSSMAPFDSSTTDTDIQRHIDSVFEDSTSNASESSTRNLEMTSMVESISNSGSSVSFLSSSSSSVYSEFSFSKLFSRLVISRVPIAPIETLIEQQLDGESSDHSSFSSSSMMSAHVNQGFFNQIFTCCRRHNQVENANHEIAKDY